MGFLAKAVVGALGLGGAYALGKSASNDDKDTENEVQQSALNEPQQKVDDDLPPPQESGEKPIWRSSNTILDNHLQNGRKLTIAETRAFKEAGINPADFGDQTYKVDMKARLNLKKDFNTLAELKSANYLLDEAISKSKDNLGVGGAIDRGLHHATGKFWNMNDNNAEFEILHENAVKSFARAQEKGRLSNQDKKRIEKYYGLGAMRDNYYEKMFVIKQKLTEDMRQELIALQNQGRQISDDDMAEYRKAKQSLVFLRNQIDNINTKKQKDFDYKGFTAQFLQNRRNDFVDTNAPQNQSNTQNYQRIVPKTRTTPQNASQKSASQMVIFKDFKN